MNIDQVLINRFPNLGPQEIYRTELANVCKEFIDSGKADSNFISKFSSGDGAFWSCVSEALVFRYLKGKNFLPRNVNGGGPDFLIEHEGRRIWIEVVCPTASGVPSDWLVIKNNCPNEVPHSEILLRWTGSIKDKMEQLNGSKEKDKVGYLEKKIIHHDDVFVIAVNGCQLRHGPFPALYGISQFPYAVEAVFPIGPLELRLSRETQKIQDANFQERYAIPKSKNNTSVPSYLFLQSSSHMISAIWALDVNGASCVGNSEPMAVIHNPNATNKLPVGFLPCDKEYGAKRLENDEYEFFQY